MVKQLTFNSLIDLTRLITFFILILLHPVRKILVIYTGFTLNVFLSYLEQYPYVNGDLLMLY